jgi:hypothetical protein
MKMHAKGSVRRWLAAAVVAILAATGVVAMATAEPAAAAPCDAPTPQSWLGSWTTDDVAESGGAAQFKLQFLEKTVVGNVHFVAGQTVLANDDSIAGTRTQGTCAFSATVGGAVYIEGSVSANGLGISGAWKYGSYTGSWRAGLVTDFAEEENVTALTTDETAAGVSAADPIATTVESPVAGSMEITEAVSAGGVVSGYGILGTAVHVAAPAGSVAAPLELTFDVHSSVTGGASSVALFRNGVLVLDCVGVVPPLSDRDPCVKARTPIANGLRITALTSQASTWFLGLKKSDDVRIVSDKLLSSKLGEPYTKVLIATNVKGTAKWKKLTKLPKGLKLAAKTGVISGIPKKVDGTFTFKVALIDKVKVPGQAATKTIVEKPFTLTVKKT